MKTIILLFFAFSFIGVFAEIIFRILISAKTIKEKLTEMKIYLMLPIYGIGCTLISFLNYIPILRKIEFLPLLMFFGMLIATLFEFGSGYILNVKLKLNIWDYSNSNIKIFGKKIPLNILGQIDLYHCLLWSALTIVVIYFSSIIKSLAS